MKAISFNNFTDNFNKYGESVNFFLFIMIIIKEFH